MLPIVTVVRYGVAGRTEVSIVCFALFPLPLAAGGHYPELALALARGERPAPRLGDFREGIVMTRFFSDLSLTRNGDGTLKPLAPAE